MSHTIFITGGARSGKSVYAEQRTREFGAPLVYLATAQALDGEMSERIVQHQQRRGGEWVTMEEPLDLAGALKRCDGTCRAVLVDCITLWLSNLICAHEHAESPEELIQAEVQRVTDTLKQMSTPVILVSNEVGMGIVPENRLARIFRDAAGRVNQMVAAAADEAHVVISGIPLKLK